MASTEFFSSISNEVETVNFDTETWLKFRDETETSSKNSENETETRDVKFEAETDTRDFAHFAETCLKTVVITSDFKLFFKFLAFFPHVLVVSYLQIKQTKSRWIVEILINYFFAIFKVSRPETFETETCKNESRDRDQVSRLHHCHLYLFSSRPGCPGWIMKNRVKTRIFEVINSSATSMCSIL